MSAPTKPDSEKKVNTTISLDRETADYAKAHIQPLSPWVRDQIRNLIACDLEYVKLRAAEKAIRLKEQAEEAETAFRDTYGTDAHTAKVEAIRAADQATALAQTKQQEVEDKRYAEIWSLIKDKPSSKAVSWLQARSKDYGFKDSPVDTYDKIRAWAEQSGAG